MANLSSDSEMSVAKPGTEHAKTLEDMRKVELVSWVMTRVDRWRNHRDSNFRTKWAEYYRLWRGFWDPADKSKDIERSKLISPALQQAVEMTVAEMEEATFGRGVWFDVSDDYTDPEKQDVELFRDQLLDDFAYCDVPAAVSECYLNGALYGTAVAKVMIGRKNEEFYVHVEPISPHNFVIDPSARTVDEALGCAHEIAVPKHRILEKQQKEIYYSEPIAAWSGEWEMFNTKGEVATRDFDRSDVTFITEYHGKVPRRLIDPDTFGDSASKRQTALGDDGQVVVMEDDDLVESIVTIANKGTLLRDVENPYTNKDRAIVAYQHETVPNAFWGRGVSEKGYNGQKALDAELRARIDALGLLTYPVMGADATRLPRGLDLRIKPGKLFLTNGRPSEVLEPIIFGNLNPATFQQTADLERLVQMGTGAMDSATPLDANRRNETSSGMSMQFSGFVKRAKRTMLNVEREFLNPIITKSLWRYMQFAPERYPVDLKFVVHSSLGIMAREYEQAALGQLLQVVPPESPLFNLLVKGMIENGALPNKGELVSAIEQMMQPASPEAQAQQEQMQQLQQQGAIAEIEKLIAEVGKIKADTELSKAKTLHTAVQADLEDEKIEIMAAQTVVANNNNIVKQQGNQISARKNEQDTAQRSVDGENKAKSDQQKAKSKKKESK